MIFFQKYWGEKILKYYGILCYGKVCYCWVRRDRFTGRSLVFFFVVKRYSVVVGVGGEFFCFYDDIII